eukprot:5922924-Amphidinium_carterae.1
MEQLVANKMMTNRIERSKEGRRMRVSKQRTLGIAMASEAGIAVTPSYIHGEAQQKWSDPRNTLPLQQTKDISLVN